MNFLIITYAHCFSHHWGQSSAGKDQNNLLNKDHGSWLSAWLGSGQLSSSQAQLMGTFGKIFPENAQNYLGSDI